jgi:hypothetical protein
MKCIDEQTGKFFIASCDGAIDLEMADHALDHISPL